MTRMIRYKLDLKLNAPLIMKMILQISLWLKTGHMSRKCYLVDNGPGTLSETPTSGLKP